MLRQEHQRHGSPVQANKQARCSTNISLCASADSLDHAWPGLHPPATKRRLTAPLHPSSTPLFPLLISSNISGKMRSPSWISSIGKHSADGLGTPIASA